MVDGDAGLGIGGPGAMLGADDPQLIDEPNLPRRVSSTFGAQPSDDRRGYLDPQGSERCQQFEISKGRQASHKYAKTLDDDSQHLLRRQTRATIYNIIRT